MNSIVKTFLSLDFKTTYKQNLAKYFNLSKIYRLLELMSYNL